MKKIILTVSLAITVLGFSQDVKIENGMYTAQNNEETISLMIQDGKFHISIFTGDFKIKKDSVFLNDDRIKKLGFSIKQSFNNKIKPDKIQVTLKERYYDEISTIFIGTQNGNNTQNYKSIQEIYANSMNDRGLLENLHNTDVIFEIDKSDYIFLACEDIYEQKTEISKFRLPLNVNAITIDYTKIKLDAVNLLGTYDEKTREFTISNNNREPLVFKKSNTTTDQEDQNILPLETSVQKNWTYPGKKVEIIETATPAFDTIASTTEALPVYKFSNHKNKNFKDALKNVSKYSEKFLVVSLDLKNKNRKSEFDEFIKNDELLLNDSYGYVETNNKFDYYLATEKDKNLLAKHKIKSESEILVFNAKGDLIYHIPESLKVNITLFSGYDNAYSELQKANQQLEFDRILLNKKSTNKAIVSLLKKKQAFFVGNSELEEEPVVLATEAVKENSQDIPVKFVAPRVVKETDPDYEEAKQAIKYNDSIYNKTDEELKTINETEMPPAKVEEVKADEIYEDPYSIIKNPKNLYQLKSSYEMVVNKWEQIVTKYEKSKKIDVDFVSVVKKELSDEGFSKTIFEVSSTKKVDFKMLNYVFDNYKILSQEVEPQDKATNATISSVDATTMAVGVANDAVDTVANDTIKTEEYEMGIKTTLDNYFYRATGFDYNHKDLNIKKTVFEYYRKYLELIDYKTDVVKKYMSALDEKFDNPTKKNEYFEMFEIYFNKIILPNKSIIENLDANFTENLATEYNWSSYKSDFATDCNQTAWEIVKMVGDKNLVSKAIKWSEASNELDKKNHYYTDTLARLYYLNGQKEKALTTQQKAIDLGRDSENSEDYRNVLQEMKAGSYTLPKE